MLIVQSNPISRSRRGCPAINNYWTHHFMNSLRLALTVGFLSLISPVLAGAGPELQPGPSPSEENKNSTELFAYDTVYTGDSNFYDDHGTFGHGDSLYNDFTYAHRFHITGNWYFRAGVEYERFDFGGSDNG